MSFRPARFTDIQRSGPPTTRNGREWVIPISGQPAVEWLEFFRAGAGDASGVAEWVPNAQSIQLRFRSSPDDVPQNVQSIDAWIAQANGQYRSWLEEAHRKGDERRRGEQTEADRVQGLNERFRDL